MDPCDKKWIDALKPYLGGGIVPIFRISDGSVDAQRTLERFAEMKGIHKLGANGEQLP